MLKAAVVIDDWKLPIFRRHLIDAGYSFTEGPGVTADTLTLMVMTNSVLDLKPVIQAANGEAARGKPQ